MTDQQDQRPLEIARESLAKRTDDNQAAHTASLYRSGRYDDQGEISQHMQTAEMALEIGEKTGRELACLVAEFLFRKDQYHERDSGKRLDAMSFAEDQLRKHTIVAEQLVFYAEREDDK